jgi:hypothetical protein
MADDATPYAAPSKKTDTAPKGRGKSTTGKPLIPIEEIRDRLKTSLTSIGMMVYAKNEVDGVVIMGSAPSLVDAYCDLAKHNKYVHKALSGFVAVDGSLGILTATAVPALAIAKNHGMYHGPLLVSIEELERRVLEDHPDLGSDIDYRETDDSDLDA